MEWKKKKAIYFDIIELFVYILTLKKKIKKFFFTNITNDRNNLTNVL